MNEVEDKNWQLSHELEPSDDEMMNARLRPSELARQQQKKHLSKFKLELENVLQ